MNKSILIEQFEAETLLKQFAEIKQELNEIKKNFVPKKPVEYMNRHQVAKMLGVSLVTLHSWINKGILQPYYIGNKTLFKRYEIDEVLNKSVKRIKR